MRETSLVVGYWRRSPLTGFGSNSDSGLRGRSSGRSRPAWSGVHSSQAQRAKTPNLWSRSWCPTLPTRVFYGSFWYLL